MAVVEAAMATKTTRYPFRLGGNGPRKTEGVLAFDGDTYVYKPTSPRLHTIVSREVPNFLQAYLPLEPTEKHQEIRRYYETQLGTSDPLEILARKERRAFVGPVQEAEGEAQAVAELVLPRAQELLIMQGMLATDAQLGREFKQVRAVPDDPPDLVCETPDGRTVGIELGEWLHQEQITRRRILGQLERQIRQLVAQDSELSAFVATHRVQLSPHSFDRSLPDKKAQRQALAALVEELRQAAQRGDEYLRFDEEPLSSLFEYAGIHPLADAGIHISMDGWYDPADTQRALHRLIDAKAKKYADLKAAKNLDELVLVTYYHQVYWENSPYRGGDHSTESVVEAAQRVLREDHGPFDRVYLYIALETPHGKVFRLWPAPIAPRKQRMETRQSCEESGPS